ncbi:hypothetical protein O7632_19495 [Solwaraspora sp. WMMD406]|uniref:hypothetical protein n=1 Tax=Solwaraspora sp. WMMD406 TaxID=3016095 RepID=UPI0024169711|nr:hypothetical protein [Solwaraspora sp. WMMD406]MDG4766271.1 hypothetical protein [Solwaraspora sp. WMMD406]
MSLVHDLAARVRATADDLPVGHVALAVERLRAATELLIWVRQESSDPMAVPQLTNATEHAEQAGHAIRVAQQSVTDYLGAIGMGAAAPAGPDDTWRTALRPAERSDPADPARTGAPELGNWWAARVAELTDRPAGPPTSPAAGPPESPAATDTTELLRQVAHAVRAQDRATLHRDLAAAATPTGLNLAAVTPPVLHRLAGDLLDHEPRPEDLRRLATAAGRPVRELLPGMPESVLDTLLARICRVPPEHRRDRDTAQAGHDRRTDPDEDVPPHPADAAVAGAVLTGVLLRLLDREPQTLRADQPQPVRGRDA